MTSIKYMTSLLTFYLKGEIRTEKNFIQFKAPNTILGLIPLGAKTENFTIDQISSTTTNFRLRLKYLIFGIFWLLIAVSCLSDSDTLAAGLICLKSQWLFYTYIFLLLASFFFQTPKDFLSSAIFSVKFQDLQVI